MSTAEIPVLRGGFSFRKPGNDATIGINTEVYMEQGNLVIILAALLAISEALALIPGIKSNSIFTLVVNILKGLVKPK